MRNAPSKNWILTLQTITGCSKSYCIEAYKVVGDNITIAIKYLEMKSFGIKEINPETGKRYTKKEYIEYLKMLG